MSRIVQKYGGSSVASPEHIRRVAQNIIQLQKQGHQVVVVVSAMGDTTDHLVKMAKEISKNPPEREMDMLLSVGERISIAILAMAIHDLGGNAISFTGSQVGIITDTKHTEARILEIRANRILEELDKGRIVIVAGFQGVSIQKEITTLGRGGSDTTAIALAAALKADRCEIMKDVDGIFIAEPKLIPRAKLNHEISYDELIELTNMGAGVLKAESVEIAKMHHIKVGVGSSFTGNIGTIITDKSLDISRVSGIVGLRDLARVTLKPPASSPFRDVFIQIFQTPVRLFTYQATPAQIQFTTESISLPLIQALFSDNTGSLTDVTRSVEEQVGLISVIGSNMNFNTIIPSVSLGCLRQLDVLPLQFDISKLRLSFLVPQDQIDPIIQLLYQEFEKAGVLSKQ